MKKTVFIRLFPACLIAFVSSLPASAGTIKQLVVFGDSLSDAGNWYIGTNGTSPAPPYYNGRMTNGPTWVDVLASQLGLPTPLPSQNNGTNCAWSGARTGVGYDSYANYPSVSIPRVGTQISTYLANHSLHSDDLIILLAGGNDFGDGGQRDPSVPLANMLDHITTLANAGGKLFLVPTVPPLGEAPDYRGTPDGERLNTLIPIFNSLLGARLHNLERTLGITVYEVDFYGTVEEAIHDPASIGFTDVTNAAIYMSNPDKYLWWDTGGHYTRVLNQAVGLRAAAAVPEPSAVALLTVGSVFLLACARRRRTTLGSPDL